MPVIYAGNHDIREQIENIFHAHKVDIRVTQNVMPEVNRFQIEVVNETFGLRLQDPNYDTIAGYVLGRLNRLAQIGDTTTVLPDTFPKLRPIAARSTADHKAARGGGEIIPGQGQRVSGYPEGMKYSPQWESSGSGFDTVAYGIYSFDLTARAGRPVINTAWERAPKDYGTIWLGASNWAKDRWDWYSAADKGSAQTIANSMDIYRRAGTNEMYVAVVVLGIGSSYTCCSGAGA